MVILSVCLPRQNICPDKRNGNYYIRQCIRDISEQCHPLTHLACSIDFFAPHILI